MPLLLSYVVAVVGFEQTSYTFNEFVLSGEVCVVVTNPPPIEELVFRITLQANSRAVTARKL